MNKVSINILHYNSFEKTKICIESCLKQNINNCEIIIIDNNSQNDSLKKLKEAKNRYDIFHMLYYFHHNSLIRCHFDEILSESCSAGFCDHFDIKF